MGEPLTIALPASDSPIIDINQAIEAAKSLESYLQLFRKEFGGTVHPWAMPSLANAVGSIQNCRCHLEAARHQIEAPIEN